MTRSLGAVAVAAGLALTVAGCSGGTVRKDSQAAGNQTFTYSFNLNVVTDWDPATSDSNEIIAMQNIYESLTRYDPVTKTVKPELATSWTKSADGRTWTFTLRKGVKFHDGNALTAKAAKAAIERTVKLQGGPAYIWDSVTSIDTPSPTTLVFHLKYAAPLDLTSSSDYGAYIYDTAPAGVTNLKTWLEQGHDTGSGPYTVAQWNKGQEAEVRLLEFKDYWGGWSGSHYTSVVFNDTPTVTTAWQQLQTGEASFAEQLNPELFAEAKSTRGLQTQATPSLQNLIAFFNTASGPLKDVRLRKAVQNAIDYDGLVSALKGSVTAAQGIIPSGLLGNDPSLVRHQNIALATQLLNQAGYGPGKKPLTLSLTYAQGDDAQQTFVTLLSSELKALNVTLDAKPMQWDAQWAKGKSSDPSQRQDIYLMYWYPDYADAYSWFLNLFHSATPVAFNMSYLNNPAVDKMIDSLPQLTATNRTQAQATYERLQQDLLDTQAVAAPLYVETYQRVYASSVEGYTDNPAYPNVVFVHDLTPSS